MEDFRELFEQMLEVRHMAKYIAAVGVVLLIISGFVWWQFVHASPYNVWWGMLDNSLSTKSVTKHILQDSGTQSLDQYIGQQFGVKPLIFGRTALASNGNVVRTETVGTLSHDFVRYTSIQSGEKGADGKPLTFGQVLGKWAEAPAGAPSGSGALPFFEQTMLGIGGGNLIPIANLNASQRHILLESLHKNVVFKTSFDNVKKQSVNGRQVYVYSVAIEPVAYIGFEKSFASALGIHTLDGTDPNQYQGQPPINAEVSVDAWSHQLAQISLSKGGHREIYQSFGVPIAAQVPHATISIQDLQSRIRQAQQ